MENKMIIKNRFVEIINPISKRDISYIIEEIDNGFKNLKKVGNGGFGTIYKHENYAIKTKRDERKHVDLDDIKVLRDISHLEFIPTLYAVIDNETVIVDFIEGKTVYEYTRKTNIRDNVCNINEDSVIQFKNHLIDIIELGYTPDDLHGLNVMIDFRTNTLKIIDVGLFYKHNKELSNIHNFAEYDEGMSYNEGYSYAMDSAGYDLQEYVDKTRLQKEAKSLVKKYKSQFEYVVN